MVSRYVGQILLCFSLAIFFQLWVCHDLEDLPLPWSGQTGTLALVPAALDSRWDLGDKSEVLQRMLCFQNGYKMARFEL